MNWTVWDRVEAVLIVRGIKPIMAVVPDNRDPGLMVEAARPTFWERVRKWDGLGWTIAVHGFQHVYSTTDAGIVGVNRRSEFAGLSRDTQAAALDAALKIFRDQGLQPRTWVAPGHSFDATTVACLLERGITVISDGFFPRVVREMGCTWIPQQLWRFRRVPFGTWTVCYHVNSWTERQYSLFVADIGSFGNRIVDVGEVLTPPPGKRRVLDTCFAGVYRRLVLGRRVVGSRAAAP